MTEPSSAPNRPLAGDDIIAEILRNAAAGQFPIRRTVLVPCVFHVYLHPAEYDLIRPALPALVSETRIALSQQVDRLNKRARPPKVARFLGFEGGDATTYKILDPDWTVEFHPDLEDKLGRGDLEVHSDMASAARPEFDGAMTRHVTRKHDASVRSEPRPEEAVSAPDSEATKPVGRESEIFGWLRYTEEGTNRTFPITKDEIAIGRGGKAVWVDVKVTAPPDVSREHCRVRRDASTGRFFLKDLSQFGTSLDGRKIPSSIDRRGGAERDTHVEVELPLRAAIGLADVVTVEFEAAEVL